MSETKQPSTQHSATPLRQLPAFKALEAHFAQVKDLSLRKLFADDATRGERLALEAEGFYFDYSKNRITDETLKLLLELAEQSGLRAKIDAMFRGDKINITEQRAVLHVQNSGREEVTGANVLVALFTERESHAAYFLQEQDMTRYDAVNYISHGIAKRPGM